MAQVTGDELNYLNGKYAISSPANSVPVMKLIKYHRPYTEAELEVLICSHVNSICDCGVRSKGDVSAFAKNLYEAQQKEWSEYRYSLEVCEEWQYNLFIRQSMKGRMMELKAMALFRDHFPGCEVSLASDHLDENYRVDIVMSQNDTILWGIQVKPESFKNARSSVQQHHARQNASCPFPVIYLYYNKSMDFINFNILKSDMNQKD